jgi:ABC-type Fe3+ transport system substrate-binding protein
MTRIPPEFDLDPARRTFGDPFAAERSPRGLDLLASSPVPLRMQMRDDLAQVIGAHIANGGTPFKCFMPLGQGGRTPMEQLRLVRKLDEFPKLLVSSENGNAFNRAFHAEHVEQSAFCSMQPKGAARAFVEAGLIDPRGWIGVYAVAPFVLLIDRQQLGSRPVPQSWAELADPLYRGAIIFSGWRRAEAQGWRTYNHLFLLMMLRLLGESGLWRLLTNAPTLMHSAQMPRLAGGGASPGAIYVLPWAQAALCPRRDRTQIVWPSEGAMAFPLWMTAQAAHRDRIAPLADYFFDPATADWLDRNLYPSLAPSREAGVPDGAGLAFPGWDYLRHRSAAQDLKRAVALFDRSREFIEIEGRKCAS